VIKTVSNGNISVNFYQNGPMYGVDIKDGSGLGMHLTIDQFEELKSMIDFIWGQNNLWRFRTEESPHPVCDGRLR
jgi:hypothetical protein